MYTCGLMAKHCYKHEQQAPCAYTNMLRANYKMSFSAPARDPRLTMTHPVISLRLETISRCHNGHDHHICRVSISMILDQEAFK